MLEKLIQEIKEAQGPLSFGLELVDIEDAGIKLLAEAIKEANVPITLFLSYTIITIEWISSLAKTIKQVRNEFTLCLVDTGIGVNGTSLLAEGIKEAKISLNLNLSGNNLEDEGAKLLGDAIKDARVALNLCLSGNRIRADGASFLADGIKQAKGSLNIDLSRNSIGNEGAMFFAVAIREKESPLNLCLSSNSIGKDGIACLASAIEYAESPVTLDVSGNNIGDANITLLANAIKAAKTPVELDWSTDWIEGICRRVNFSDGITRRILHDAIADNFVVDARKDPSKFLATTELNLCGKMLERGLGYPVVLATIITSYISDEDLAWTEVATIRAVKGASYENKYSSINYELLNSVYFGPKLEAQQSREMIPASKVSGCNKQKEGNLTSSVVDIIEKDGNKGSNDVGSEKPNLSSRSLSSGPYEPHCGYDGGAQQLKLSSQRHIMFDYLSNDVEASNYINEQTFSEDKNSAAETSLMTFFTWIKDLSKALQQQILSSFSMQQVLKVLETTSDKVIAEQVSTKKLKEIFTEEHKKYYVEDDLVGNLQEYAQQHDFAKLINDDGFVVSSGGILTVLSINYDINSET